MKFQLEMQAPVNNIYITVNIFHFRGVFIEFRDSAYLVVQAVSCSLTAWCKNVLLSI